MQSELEGLPSQIADLSVNCSEQRDRIAMFKQDNAERVTLGWPLRYDGLDKLGADVLSISSNRLAKLKADQRRLPKAVELTKLDLELRKQGKGKEADRILTDIAKQGQDEITNCAALLLNLRQSITNFDFYAKRLP